jgi:Mycothiol maleylpyruvate isomerase N-terminal domain
MTDKIRHHKVDVDRFPELEPFVTAVQQRRPDTGTWCEAWTVRDVVVHQTGNAEELARVLDAHLAGESVSTRSFEEREPPFRALNDADLWTAFLDKMAYLSEVAEAAESLPADTDVAWTGRQMKAPCFAEHMREELVLHGWDITGDDDAARERLSQRWMTDHSVFAVGVPLLRKGAKKLGLGAGQRIEARLRVPDGAEASDVVLTADTESTTIDLVPAEGPATLETDAATRVLLLWGRRPADPSRLCSQAGPETLGRLRTLLSGY